MKRFYISVAQSFLQSAVILFSVGKWIFGGRQDQLLLAFLLLAVFARDLFLFSAMGYFTRRSGRRRKKLRWGIIATIAQSLTFALITSITRNVDWILLTLLAVVLILDLIKHFAPIKEKRFL